MSVEEEKGSANDAAKMKISPSGRACSGSDFVASGGKNFRGVGLISHHPFFDPTKVAECPRQVKLYDLFGVNDRTPVTKEEVVLARELAKTVISYNDLSQVCETKGRDHDLGRELTIHHHHLEPMTHVFPALKTTTTDAADLEAIDSSFGMATKATMPDGYVVDKQGIPRLIWEAASGSSTPSESMRKGLAEATNVAMTQLRRGVNHENIAVPVVSSNGYLLQIGAVIVLRPSFPMFVMLTPVLDLFDMEMRNRAARVLRYIFQFVSTPLLGRDSVACGAGPDTTKMILSTEWYHLKPLNCFFQSTDNLQTSLLHYYQVLQVLHADERCRNFVVFPYCVREYGDDVEESCLVFPKLVGYKVGLPKSQGLLHSYLQLLEEAVAVFHSVGVVHLDLFVANIMWKPLGADAVELKIVDWDAAHFVWESFPKRVSKVLNNRRELAMAVMSQDNVTRSSHPEQLTYFDICLLRVMQMCSTDPGLQEGSNEICLHRNFVKAQTYCLEMLQRQPGLAEGELLSPTRFVVVELIT